MFTAHDTRDGRRAEILGYMKNSNQCVAVVFAIADFEWTIRRAIRALCHLPAPIVKEIILGNCSGLQAYQKVWDNLIANNKNLTPPNKDKDSTKLPKLIPQWDSLISAYRLRNVIVHGVQGSAGLNFATNKIQYVIDATDSILDFCSLNGVDLYKNLRYVKRQRNCNNCMAFKTTKQKSKPKKQC